jgi:hypothetical protein
MFHAMFVHDMFTICSFVMPFFRHFSLHLNDAAWVCGFLPRLITFRTLPASPPSRQDLSSEITRKRWVRFHNQCRPLIHHLVDRWCSCLPSIASSPAPLHIFVEQTTDTNLRLPPLCSPPDLKLAVNRSPLHQDSEDGQACAEQ